MGNIQEAASKITQCLFDGGVVHTFGIGHSFMPSKEAFFRRGGVVPVNPIYDANFIGAFGGARKLIKLESLEGYAPMIFEGQDVRKGEVFVQFSITGVSPVTVEINEEAKRRDLFTIAITNVRYSKAMKPKHSSGLRLIEAADLVIDNCGEVGDATIEVPGFDHIIRAGGTASITAIMIWNMIFLQVIENYKNVGLEPPVIVPTLFEGAAERNEIWLEKYKDRFIKQY